MKRVSFYQGDSFKVLKLVHTGCIGQRTAPQRIRCERVSIVTALFHSDNPLQRRLHRRTASTVVLHQLQTVARSYTFCNNYNQCICMIPTARITRPKLSCRREKASCPKNRPKTANFPDGRSSGNHGNIRMSFCI